MHTVQYNNCRTILSCTRNLQYLKFLWTIDRNGGGFAVLHVVRRDDECLSQFVIFCDGSVFPSIVEYNDPFYNLKEFPAPAHANSCSCKHR